jgi:hypothetical protein
VKHLLSVELLHLPETAGPEAVFRPRPGGDAEEELSSSQLLTISLSSRLGSLYSWISDDKYVIQP